MSESSSKATVESAPPEIVLPPNNYARPDAELLADLRRVSRVVKSTTLSRRTYDKYGRFSSMTIANRFGSWTRGVERAGLRCDFHPVSTVALFVNLYIVWRRCFGKPPARSVNPATSRWPWQTYVNRFGSWYRALRAFDAWFKIPANRAMAQQAWLVEKDRPMVSAAEERRRRRYIDCANLEVSEEACEPASGRVGESKIGSRYISAGARYRVLVRDGFRCRVCGRSPALEAGVVLHVDHIKPRARGGGRGGKSLRNLQTLCRECNLGKRDG